MEDYIPPGRQVILSDTLHEFTECGRISQWNMIFSCSASSDGNGYPLELQVFRQSGNSRNFWLLETAQVTLTDDQCERQLISFNVSLPFCERNHVGMHVPDSAGIAGLGYRGNSQNSYMEKEQPEPPSVGERVSFVHSDSVSQQLPLVSIGMYCLQHHNTCSSLICYISYASAVITYSLPLQ